MVIKQKPASATHDLIIVERAETFPAKLHETIKRKNFTVRQAKDLEGLETVLSQSVNPIVIVYCGPTPGTHEYTNQFYEFTKLITHPLLIIGVDVDGLQAKFGERFSIISTLRHPCSQSDLLNSINYIAEVFQIPESERRRSRESAPEAVAQTTSVQRIKPGEIDEDLNPLGHSLFESNAPIANLLFEQLRNYDLVSKSLGGDSYPKLAAGDGLQAITVLPSDPTLRDLTTKMLDEGGKWFGHHLRRTAYIVGRIIEPLQLPGEIQRDAYAASFLFGLSLTKRSRSLIRKEYLGKGSLILRKELCSALKDSAFKLSVEHHALGAGGIVAKMARLVGREEPVTDEPDSVAACAVMAADLVNRLCFQSGHWNPRAAYSLLKRIKAGRYRDAHPAVLCCLAKFLSEALSESPPAHLLPKRIREDATLKDRARERESTPIALDEQRVALSNLAPGMRLAQPLVAFDGRHLLDGDLVLDQDLIWRIWQLSAVRPITGSVVVNKELEEDLLSSTPESEE